MIFRRKNELQVHINYGRYLLRSVPLYFWYNLRAISSTNPNIFWETRKLRWPTTWDRPGCPSASLALLYSRPLAKPALEARTSWKEGFSEICPVSCSELGWPLVRPGQVGIGGAVLGEFWCGGFEMVWNKIAEMMISNDWVQKHKRIQWKKYGNSNH